MDRQAHSERSQYDGDDYLRGADSPGKTETFKRFREEVLGNRRSDYEASRRRLGMTKEAAWLQQTPQGDMAIVSFEAANPQQVFQGLATSQEPFDVWFRQYTMEVHGLDLTQPMPGPLPEQTFAWQAQ